jgi:hypothetical protein
MFEKSGQFCEGAILTVGVKNLNTVLSRVYYYCTYGAKNEPNQTSARPYKNVLAFVACYRISTYIFDMPEERMFVLLARDITYCKHWE